MTWLPIVSPQRSCALANSMTRKGPWSRFCESTLGLRKDGTWSEETHVFSGDVQGAKSAYRQCLAISPYATDCPTSRSWTENEGDCKDAENLSRTWLTAQPNSSQAFRRLANAVFGRGGSIEAAREISAQSLLVLTPADRRFGAARREMTLGILRGNFGLALDQATAAESALESSDEEPHERTALSIMRIQRELGNMDEVVRTADNFAKRRDVWVKNDYFDYSIVPQTMKYLVGVEQLVPSSRKARRLVARASREPSYSAIAASNGSWRMHSQS